MRTSVRFSVQDIATGPGLPSPYFSIVKLRAGQYRIIARTGSIEDLAGMLYDPDRPALTIEEINDAIAEGGAESGMRGMD